MSVIHSNTATTVVRKVSLLLLAVFTILLATLSFTSPETAQAVRGCPGNEVPGVAGSSGNNKDPNKCYRLTNGGRTQEETGNVPNTTGNPSSNTPSNENSSNPAGNSSGGGNGQENSGTEEPEGEEDKGTTCAVEKIGWILCPIVEQSAKAADRLFHFLAGNFLEVDAELLTSNPPKGTGTITAWERARDIANIMFVIAFVIIIFSQITGQGLNNYGIKRMLPRLIIAAIAVNVSYYICQIMVDISNILGYNIMKFLQDLSTQIGPSVFGANTQGTNTETADGWLGKIAIAALAVAGVIWLIIGPLAGIVGLVLITCLVIVMILLLRKAFIVLLVVISPIAFVMYLLPNTEKYFDKWLNMFWQLLMVFPIVALLLGGGQLASTIILVAGSQVNADPAACKEAATNTEGGTPTDDPSRISQDEYAIQGECTVEFPDGSGAATWTTGLVAAGVAVAPLLAVWAVLQGALSAAGAIGGKISGAIQKGSGGIGGAVGKGVGAGQDALKKRAGANMNAAWQRTQARGLNGDIREGRFGSRVDRAAGAFARRKAARSAVLNTSKDELAREMASEASRVAPHPGLTAAGTQRVESRSIAAEQKEQAEDIQAAHLIVDNMDTGAAIAAAQEHIGNQNFDSPHLAALLEHLAKVDQRAFMQLASQVSGQGHETASSRAAAGAMSSMGGFYGGGDVAAMRRGDTFDATARAQTNIQNGSMSANNVASLSNDQVGTLLHLTQGNAQAKARVATAINGMSQDQRGNLSQQKKTNLDAHFGTDLT